MAVTPYLDLAAWRLRTMMDPSRVAALEAKRPGFILLRLVGTTSKINARLSKRYAVPFVAPAPEIVNQWLTDLVTLDAEKALGFIPSSDQDQTIVDDATKAEAEIKEAADAEKGLFDLPLNEGASPVQTSAVARGGPLSYSEPGPYEWTTLQREAANGK